MRPLPTASIPSPSRGVFHIGPFPVRAYAICILLGILAAVWLTRRRWAARGGDPRFISDLALWAVPGGLIGARLYHVITDWQLYDDDPLAALRIWDGGLGIWGGVAGGAIAGLWYAGRRGVDKRALLDAVAPALPLAQAIGRLGNWFNQELFGRPTSLPWGLEIDPDQRPSEYREFETFHPTFLYEMLWNLAVMGIVLLVERLTRRPGRPGLKPGRLFAVYVAAYTFGRFWIELIRIDPAHRIAGLRVNDWVSVAVFLVAMGFVVTARNGEVPAETASETASETARKDVDEDGDDRPAGRTSVGRDDGEDGGAEPSE